MTKIFLTIAIFATAANFCLARDTTKIIKHGDTITTITKHGIFTKITPKSRVGGTLGLQIPEDDFNNGIGFSIFFHQTISPHWFFSIDAGYLYNSVTITRVANGVMFETEVSQTSTPVTLGMNVFLTTSGIRPYFGIEVGLLSRKVKGSLNLNNQNIPVVTSRETNLTLVPTFGVSVPVSKNICIASNIKFHISNCYNIGINFGVAYLIP